MSSQPPGAGLRIRDARRHRFTGPSVFAADPGHRADLGVYLSDLVRPYGLTVCQDLVDQAAGLSYGEMAEALIGALVPADLPVDVLVLAFAVPDIRPGRATATYLSHVCPGTPMAFAICDQGTAAAFTGLRLIDSYIRMGDYRRAVLLVLEQSVLHYGTDPGAAVPTGHTGVAMLCDGTGPTQVTSVRQHTGLAPAPARERLAAELADLCADNPTGTVLLGGDLAETHLPHHHPVRVAPPGQPFTGIWWELAGALSGDEVLGPCADLSGDGGSGDQRHMVLADYDPVLGCLCLAAIGGAVG